MTLLWARVTTLIILAGMATGFWFLAEAVGGWVVFPIVAWIVLDTYCQRLFNKRSWDILCRVLQREPEKTNDQR